LARYQSILSFLLICPHKVEPLSERLEKGNLIEMIDLSQRHKVLVIEPHSDDSFIAASGFFMKYAENLQLDFCLFTASGLDLNHGFVDRQVRIDEYKTYAEYFGGRVLSVEIGPNKTPIDFESRLEASERAKIVRMIEMALTESDPDILMFMGPSFHHDHTILYESIIAALRPTKRYGLKASLVMENPTYVHDGYANPKPNVYVELDEHTVLQKLSLFKELFPSQHRPDENCLSQNGIYNWARYRGLEAQTGFAEAFRIFNMKV
jgi:LmbE family N-acetylglucosaminyl deacetylase